MKREGGQGMQWRGRIVLSTIFVMAFVATGMVPAQAHYSCTSGGDLTGVTVFFKGTVTDPFGPVNGATVYAYYQGQYHDTQTGPDGTYLIQAKSNCPLDLWATHSRRTTSAKRHFDAPLVEQAQPVDFHLKYLATTTVTPNAFRASPQMLTYTVDTTAPETGVRVPVVLPGGGTLELTRDTTTQTLPGWKRWAGTAQAAPGSEGRYAYQACVLLQSATENCNAAGAAALVSEIATASYTFDVTAPAVTSTTPQINHNTVLRRPPLTVSFADALSGVDPSSLRLSLDGGVPVAGTGSSVSYTPMADLALGVHQVVVSARDLAGNEREATWAFAVVEMVAANSQANFSPKTVKVNPQNQVPAPSSVTFSGVRTNLSPFDLRLSSSPLSAGRGILTRSATFSHLSVIFRNELGQTMAGQIQQGPVTVGHDVRLAVIEPQDSELRVNLRAEQGSLPSITAAVPTGFVVTSQAEATLSSPDEVAGNLTVGTSGDPLALSLQCPATGCAVIGKVGCRFASGPDFGCLGTYPRVTMESSDGTVSGVFGLFDVANTGSNESSTSLKYPSTNPASPIGGACGGSFTCVNALSPADYVARLTSYWSSGDLFKAFGHHYFFSIGGDDLARTAVWQASDVSPGSSTDGSCTRVREFGNAVESVSDWSMSGTQFFTPSDFEQDLQYAAAQNVGPLRREAGSSFYEMGAVDTDNLSLAPLLNASGYLQSEYRPDFGRGVDTDALIVDRPGKATLNRWIPKTETAYQRQHAEVMTGTEFSATHGTAFAFESSIYFSFALLGACT